MSLERSAGGAPPLCPERSSQRSLRHVVDAFISDVLALVTHQLFFSWEHVTGNSRLVLERGGQARLLLDCTSASLLSSYALPAMAMTDSVGEHSLTFTIISLSSSARSSVLMSAFPVVDAAHSMRRRSMNRLLSEVTKRMLNWYESFVLYFFLLLRLLALVLVVFFAAAELYTPLHTTVTLSRAIGHPSLPLRIAGSGSSH